MKTTDWKFDFSILPRWENRNLIPYVYDEFLEIPQSNMLCCIYSIAEVTMCNYLGFLAILKNKEKPSLYLNITEFTFTGNISASSDGSLIFLQPDIYYKKTNECKRPILIIDVIRNVFSYIDTNNFNPCYSVKEIVENTFKIDADEYQRKNDKRLNTLNKKEIQTDRLKWYELIELNSLPELILKTSK